MSESRLVTLQCFVALALLGLSLPSLARAYHRVFSVWVPQKQRDGWELVVLFATAVAACVRWVIAPKWIVTMFIGYSLTQQAIDLTPSSHYGVGSQALYHALFSILPHDHASLLWTNSVIGVLTVPLYATLGARYLGERRAGAIFAALVAVVPLFIKNDNSDANNVPLLFWLSGGLVLWEEYLATGEKSPLAGATILLALSAVSRPEMPVLLPVLLVLLTLALRPPRARLLDRWVLAGVLVGAILALPHVLHIVGAVDTLRERSSLPGWSLPGVIRMITLLASSKNTVLQPGLYPIVLVGFAALALWSPGRGGTPPEARRPRMFLALAAALGISVYGLDLCRANMARVQVPGALFVTLLAAAGLSFLWQAFKSTGARVALGLSVALAAVPTAFVLWQPTNEQTEEELIRRAIAVLPREKYTLVRVTRADRDVNAWHSNFTHYHFPAYLVRPPAGTGKPLSVMDWIETKDWTMPAYFYFGMRCYAQFRPEGTPPPPGDNLQPACARMREQFVLEPVFEEEVPNRGDVWLEYYGDAPALKVGLYRIHPRREASRSPRGTGQPWEEEIR